jgi:hypothetical protein
MTDMSAAAGDSGSVLRKRGIDELSSSAESSQRTGIRVVIRTRDTLAAPAKRSRPSQQEAHSCATGLPEDRQASLPQARPVSASRLKIRIGGRVICTTDIAAPVACVTGMSRR